MPRPRRCRIFAGIAALLWAFALAAQAGPNDVLTARAVPLKQALSPGDTVTLHVLLSIQHPYHVNANPASEAYLVATAVTLKTAQGIEIGKPVYPKALSRNFAFSPGKPLKVYEGTALVKVPLTIAGDATTGIRQLSGIVKYQACNEKQCLLPAQTQFATSVQVISGQERSGQTEKSPPDGAATAAPSNPAASSLESVAVKLREQYAVKGLPAIVFLDGDGKERSDLRAGEELKLKAMLMKLQALKSGAQGEVNSASAAGWMQRLQGEQLWLQLVLVFVGGLLLNLTPCVYPMIPITVGYFGAQSEGNVRRTFGLACLYVLGLSLVYSTLGVSAAFTGQLFGSLLQSPIVLIAVAIVFLLLSLSMMGLFTIQPPQFLMARSGAKKGGWGALGMGALLGIVAAPCVGPVVAALLAYVGTHRNPGLGFALFFALSLGLGLPYLLLGAFSGAIKSLPRSGMWLERSKKIFAVPLLLAALYYAYLALKPAPVAATTPAAATSEWAHATPEALAEARRNKRPVVMDFRADWCLPCLQMEKEIFSRPEVHRAAQGVTLLKVDLTRAAP